MIRVVRVPGSDYLGHPFPQRHNQLFEGLHDAKSFETHVRVQEDYTFTAEKADVKLKRI